MTALALACWGAAAQAQTYTDLNDPLAINGNGTWATGVSGNTIVGYCEDATGHYHGFSYSMVTRVFNNFDDPLALVGANWGTFAQGVSGNTIVGYYDDHNGARRGFSYDGTTFTTLSATINNYPAPETIAIGISGGTIVGYIPYSGGAQAFIYDGATYSLLPLPGTGNGGANGISGSTIVGSYTDSVGNYHGYEDNGGVYTTIEVNPGHTATEADGISGSIVVGTFGGEADPNKLLGPTYRGFSFNGTSYTAYDDPNEYHGTFVRGISGDTIVGYYVDINGQTHGFFENNDVRSTPEPGSTALFIGSCCAGLSLLARRRSRPKACPS